MARAVPCFGACSRAQTALASLETRLEARTLAIHPRKELSDDLDSHESAEELQVFYVVTVYDDDVLAGDGLLIVLHVHAGL